MKTKMLKRETLLRKVGLGAFLFVFAAAVSPGQEVLIDFETLDPGDSVEGVNTVSPILTIDSLTGTAQIVQTGALPARYGAPNTKLSDPRSRNNCLEDANGNRVNLFDVNIGTATANGFADLTPTGATGFHRYQITLNVAASSLKIRMFDFGDFNPANAINHAVVVTAKDAGGVTLDVDQLTFTSTTAVNPPLLQQSGDACDATSVGAYGYYEFSVSAPVPIKTVTIEVTAGPDPNIAFDSIRIYRTGEDGCTPGYWKNHTDAWWGAAPTAYVKEVFSPDWGWDSDFDFPKNGGILGDQMLLSALSFRGGKDLAGAASILLRTAVAAFLNASSPAFGYPLNPTEVQEAVNAALMTKDRETILDLANELDGYNNANCAIDAHYTPE